DVPLAAWAAVPDPSLTLRRRLNGVLPPDLRVRHVDVAPEGFDARWSASWRRYSYLVADDPAGQDPRTRGHVLWHPRALDVEAMDAACAPFVGEHDFAAFCRAREGASSVRTLHDIGWRRVGRSAGAASPVEFSVRADAFCHSMVPRTRRRVHRRGGRPLAGRAPGPAAGRRRAGARDRDRPRAPADARGGRVPAGCRPRQAGRAGQALARALRRVAGPNG
ncbi:MAG: hypothetical protein MUF09_11160, partial [Candidatus Nanopelagicales bacterium]|nr:hypothetical protein [Candidatus Nanopelagicales bacterium]